ncbi:MAG: transposase [Desulfobacteraceae bacterium]|nr:transposase [Desulfobacteraceae bacterium]
MNRIDEIFTESLFYGSRKIRETLRREDWGIGRERVESLMRTMVLTTQFTLIYYDNILRQK